MLNAGTVIFDTENGIPKPHTPPRKRRITSKIAAKIANSESQFDIGVIVFPKGEKWNVRISAKERINGSYSTKEEAMNSAEKLIENANRAYIGVFDNMARVTKIIRK